MKELYLQKALDQIPRLLSLLDRNPLSPTYGSFFRPYWHEKIIDFPNAHFQCSIYSLALIYKKKLSKNIYYKNKNLKSWILAAMNYTKKIQHSDGSFDEFYPNEKGRAVTAIIAYDILETYLLLKDEMEENDKKNFIEIINKSFKYINTLPPLKEGVLANHISMIMCFLVLYSYEFSNKKLPKKYEEYKNSLLNSFSDEGWFLEYDGLDPGYLTTTISFIAKFWKYYQDQDLRECIEKSIQFVSEIIFPDGSFGGSIGSRQTVHFYPHGFEFFAKQFPLAHSCADKMLESLKHGNLVPPNIQSDRYIYYRIEEFLLSYLDHIERKNDLPPLACDRRFFEKYYKVANIFIKKENSLYLIINFSKGGTIKAYNNNNLILNDSGINIVCDKNKRYSSQWMSNQKTNSYDNQFKVSGLMQPLPYKYFNVFTMSLFKITMKIVGFNRHVASILKTLIRKKLILKSNRFKSNKIQYIRTFFINKNEIIIKSEVKTNIILKILSLGGEFHIRFVPQSRYFQKNDLKNQYLMIDGKEIDKVNSKKEWKHLQKISF